MKDLFVPYDIAKQLKEKGFDEPCWAWYNIPDNDIRYCYSEQRSPITNSQEDWNAKRENREVEIIGLQIYQQVVDWLREKHNILITIELLRFAYDSEKDNIHYPDNIFKYKIIKLDTWFSSYIENTHQDKDYYEALNKAIKEALKLI